MPRFEAKEYIQILCPFHDEKTPSFVINPDLYSCFSCGANGFTKSLMRTFVSYKNGRSKNIPTTFESFQAMKDFFRPITENDLPQHGYHHQMSQDSKNTKSDKEQTQDKPINSDSVDSGCNCASCRENGIRFSVSKEDITRVFELRGMLKAALYDVMTIERKGLCDLLEAINDMYDEIICDPIKESIDIE